ncbi:prepilin-type N-terminal cleavage/methylation domain-containing protein [Neobacillus notoginsengisoli]|uniref:Prepilin-type N-terminal cleavage/methylation domain-containing protein n=1 Tax=Neobacillus notoginsengisoli TaxID=1578198 RepID=A0A417YTY6_9BACI|nr:prepilin-type N-terminal cleavage/methylation domain-containing protein [Neobacillus notoginsengisoli]RHW40641.1 prepilin-type N-terminal cleavage/methylation domain-containing protein [Neobacillus notoginsengisoli]
MFKSLKKKMKDQRGLTLIELLAVIVILGIIAAIAIPAIGGLISKTKDDAKVSEALQIISAAKLAHASNATVQEWDQVALADMVENVKDPDGFTVKYSPTTKKYSIVGHHSAAIIDSGYTATTEVTETELLNYSGN